MICLFSQMPVDAQQDTPAYSELSTDLFVLDSVTTGKSNHRLRLTKTCYAFMQMEPASEGKTRSLTRQGLRSHGKDSIVRFTFDLESHHDVLACDGHTTGFLRVNRKSHTLMIDKISELTRKPVRRMFRIERLTSGNLVLKDLSYPHLNRIYYFHKY